MRSQQPMCQNAWMIERGFKMLGTKKGKWVLRIFAFLIAGVVQYAYTAHAEKRAYNNGYLVAKAEYAEATKTQLNDTFKKHQELAEQYRTLGNCHNAQ